MTDSKTETAPVVAGVTEEKFVTEQKLVKDDRPAPTLSIAQTDEPKTDGAKNDKPAVDGVKNDEKPTEPTKETKETSPSPNATTSPVGRTPPRSLEIDKTKPADFEGEIATTNEIPSPETLKKLDNYLVLDRHGKSHTFKSLYAGSNVARRVLIIFVRHFFCGNCQEFLRSLSESINPDALLRLPVSTFIAVIGNGDPGLIDMYVRDTSCPYPVYTDPKHSLFDALGMTKTWNMGEKPAYMKKGLMHNIVTSVVQGLKQVPTGKALKSGDFKQVGGEFLFEPLDLATPIHTPQLETPRPMGAFEGDGTPADDGEEVKRVTWCHRMKTTRDHAEIPELMEVLGLDGSGQPIKDVERWEKALETRKGTGLSMASEMSKLSQERSRTD